MKMKKALITGVTGQDGSYLAEFLLKKGYEVFGVERRVALQDQKIRNERLQEINVKIIPCDIGDYGSVLNVIMKVMPDEIYHLAAQSFVAESFEDPFQTIKTNIFGTLNILEAMRNITPKAKFYFAASSEMFGEVKEEPQKESTPFHPRSPYGVSKVAGFYLTLNYRESYNMFCCSGIFFNHESPRRGKEFVTRKITSALKDIKKGNLKELKLGNLEAKRDWGFAGDYVEAMWLMLQQDKPDDYVIATGETHSIKEFLEEAFNSVGLKWQDYVKVDERFIRPSDVPNLRGDSTKAKNILGWQPQVKFQELVKMMVEHDMKD
jgi:GDPmannose 4,6-dehydratase